jgi:ribokinase
MYDVISIGNATQDVFVNVSPKYAGKQLCFLPGQKIEIEGMHYFTGGGASNACAAFAKMGLKTAIVAAAGKDPAGKAIEEELKENGVSRELLVWSGSKTAYSVILTGFGKDRVILTYRGATAALTKESIKWGRLKAKWIHLSSLHKNPALTARICAFAGKRGMKVALNPGKIELGYGLAKLKKSFEDSSVLFLNDTEAMSLTGSADIERNLATLQKYCGIVVITAGAGGAYAYDGETMYHKKIFPVKVVDTTGSGDAFNSGFVAALCCGKGIDEALLWGTAQANSVVTAVGTKNILLNRRQIKRFLGSFRGGSAVSRKRM